MEQEEKANANFPGACLVGRVVKVEDGSFGTFSTVYSYVDDGLRELRVMVEEWSVDLGRMVCVVVTHEDGDDGVVTSRYLTVK
jgi:transcription antitermination factor NusG